MSDTYEWRFTFGRDNHPRSVTPWSDREITAEDLAEWQEEFVNVRAERRTVSVTYGEPEEFTP